MLDAITLFLFNIVVYNIPLLYGTAGEIMIEKSGSLNLGVEGTMAIGAVAGYVAACRTDSLAIGVLAGFVAAGLCGLIFAFLTVTLQANQNVTGLTITTFGVAFYYFVGNGLSNSGAGWPALNRTTLGEQFKDLAIPLLSKIPVIGKGLFSHNILVYGGVVIAVLMWFYFEKTIPGLRLRSIGENPAAADSLGVNVSLYKYIHIIIGSGIMGIGGLYMGLNMGGTFEGSNCWINGYGWISIALVIFANWSPARALIGTLVFGFFNTLRVYNATLAYVFPHSLGWLTGIPSHFFSALPFIITLLVLIFSSMSRNGKSGEPAAIGRNYYREDR
ncbi:MAG: ABC transporter permease [Saccharofermentans sp.]|jgi:simple sugar transport system permease protein|nr:ABC transporter permease [Mageeibacillus sp.]MCI1264515.1 ABC transporter permease [Saccharofermentans sp.]MCI1274664.1 ABC transporter permease [Saccharofermentans sp.]MCI1769299.1 ABC transporter permease [Mageeibacillus sp.]MCI2044546.1 ABC transporter permease [Mageeibacillus sp.]